MFESLTDYRKIVLLIFSIQNEKDLLKECGVLKHAINRLSVELKEKLIEQTEENLDYIKNKEKSIIEKILNK